MKKKMQTRIHNDACKVANAYQGDGYIEPERWEFLKDEIAGSTKKFYDDLVHQLKLQIRYQQELKRRVKKLSPHRHDMIREQDTAIWALQDLLKRFEDKVL